MSAHGSSIGLTATGDIDFKAGEINVSGTIVPFRVISRFLEIIPVIGLFIVGGKDEGLVGVRYNLKGKLDDPQISVNPASILAPGFLRSFFGILNVGGGAKTGRRPSAISPGTKNQ